jgi:chemotaxis methyl-accepting protein methylase
MTFVKNNLLDMVKTAPFHRSFDIWSMGCSSGEILNALADRLVEGGILVTGLAEIVDWQHPNLVQVDSNKLSIYVRRNNNQREAARR